MSKAVVDKASEEATALKLADSTREIVQRVRDGKLKSWHGCHGWIVTAAVVGGVCEFHIELAGKKMVWTGPVAGLGVGGQMSAVFGMAWVDPAQLMKSRYLLIQTAAVLVGGTIIWIKDSEEGGLAAGPLIGPGMGLGAGTYFGWGDWKSE